jgi:hypothetical protein
MTRGALLSVLVALALTVINVALFIYVVTQPC